MQSGNYFATPAVTLYKGDCREVMKQLPDASVDAVVTDPPYELKLSGSKWDATGVAFDPAVWEEAYRILKPGSHLIAFAATRLYHRLAVAVEDAGFEVRDMGSWEHEGGMPRGQKLSKQIEAYLRYGATNSRSLKRLEQEYGGEPYTVKGTNNGMLGEQVVYERKEWAPLLPEAIAAEGWGTTLRPKHEPFVLARKPLDQPNVAANMLKHGVGALNLTGSPANTFRANKPNREERKQNPHPTAKSLDNMEDLVRLVTPEGGVVLDMFTGGATTLVAARRLGMRAIGVELQDEFYVASCQRILADLTQNVY